jgi:glycosyltransferase involved in cell wall biosynthesis
MTRILHVSQPVDAGVAVVLAELAEYQHATGWDVHVACPSTGWLVDRLATNAIPHHAWQASRSPGPSSLAEARQLRSMIDNLKPDVVHLHSSKAGLAGRLALRGAVPTVFQPHAWSFHALTGTMATASTLWERLAIRWTHLVVAVSGGELDEGRSHGINPARSVVVPNGVDLKRYAPVDRAQARERLDLPAGPLAVCLGRLARQKGQDRLVAVWPQVRDLVPDATLVLVGDGPDAESLAAAAGDGVILAGPTAVPQDWYAAADLVVMPSRWEGMALVPLEAMACGRSVVGFDVTGLSEAIADAGAVVPQDDAAALATEIARRLSNPQLAAAEGLRGRERAVSRYDRAVTVSTTARAVTELVSTLSRRAA